MDNKIRITVTDPETRNAVTTEYDDWEAVQKVAETELNKQKGGRGNGDSDSTLQA